MQVLGSRLTHRVEKTHNFTAGNLKVKTLLDKINYFLEEELRVSELPCVLSSLESTHKFSCVFLRSGLKLLM